MELSRERSLEGRGLLYPMMVIAAIAVIVFSILGIISIAGWMPNVLSGSPEGPRAVATFECGECGLIETVRDLERSATAPGAIRFEAVGFTRP